MVCEIRVHLATFGCYFEVKCFLISSRIPISAAQLIISVKKTAGVRLPGLEDVPAGWAAWGALPNSVVGQMVLTWIVMEMANRDQTGNSEFAGDFRNGYLDFGWDSQTAEWKKKKRTLELNQGRAAQMGILGLMVHDAMGNVGSILPH